MASPCIVPFPWIISTQSCHLLEKVASPTWSPPVTYIRPTALLLKSASTTKIWDLAKKGKAACCLLPPREPKRSELSSPSCLLLQRDLVSPRAQRAGGWLAGFQALCKDLGGRSQRYRTSAQVVSKKNILEEVAWNNIYKVNISIPV